MGNSFFIPPEAYKYIYTIVIGFIGLIYYDYLVGRPAKNIIGRPVKSNYGIIFLAVVVILFIGLRPISAAFSDMLGYADMYNNFIYRDSDKGEIGLWWLAELCHMLGFNSTIWFLTVCAAYYGFTLKSAKLLFPNNWDYIFITFLIAFSTLTYATNGIRNGLATASLLLGMALFITPKDKKKYISLLFLAYAYLTHKSVIVPIACFFVSYYFLDFKKSIYFWIFSIFISLTVGDAVSNVFVDLGFDDRLEGYLIDADHSGFSHAGFRWDFILYSIMPIWLGYYILVKKGIHNRIYEVLLSTYVLANAFWVMVIRAQFSDRFAYLSWFMYAIVVTYPLFSIDIWGNKQGRIARNILYAHLSFTIFMNLIYYTFLKNVL